MKNFTKNFRELVEETRSGITTTSVKTSKMKTKMEKQEKSTKHLCTQKDVPALNWYVNGQTD